jgi:hypothetical protein
MAKELRTVDQQTPQTIEDGQRSAPRPTFLPPADIYETRDNIVVLAEMPGVALDGVDITFERRALTIRGRSASNDHGGYQQVIANTRMATMREPLPSRRTLTGNASRPRSRTGFYISSSIRQRLRNRERSSSSPGD